LSRHNYLYKGINRSVGKALHQYQMIADGDRIAVGLSGGKDSLALMWILNERKSRAPVNYQIFGIYIDPGFEDSYAEKLLQFCHAQGFYLKVERSNFGILAHSSKNRENPCFLCSRLRRKRLFEIASELGCSKIALGHHMDDIIETLFLNICYAGEISTMVPFQPLFNGNLNLIRPLAFTEENTIKKFAMEKAFPIFRNPCPTEKTSKRKFIKEMLQPLYKSNKKIKGNIFRALNNVKTEYLL